MESPAPSKALAALRVALGIAVAAVFVAAACFWAALSLSAALMANDSGRANENAHLAFIAATLAGALALGLAGLPLGAAVFWSARRKLLLWLFAALFLAGLVAQFGGAYVFFRSF